MKPAFGILALFLATTAAAADLPKPLVTGLKNPHSVAVGLGGKVYVTVCDDSAKDGTGALLLIDKDKAVPFATGLDAPRGIAAFQQWLFVADKKRVWRIDMKGKAEVFVAAAAFPSEPKELYALAIDPESGLIY